MAINIDSQEPIWNCELPTLVRQSNKDNTKHMLTPINWMTAKRAYCVEIKMLGEPGRIMGRKGWAKKGYMLENNLSMMNFDTRYGIIRMEALDCDKLYQCVLYLSTAANQEKLWVTWAKGKYSHLKQDRNDRESQQTRYNKAHRDSVSGNDFCRTEYWDPKNRDKHVRQQERFEKKKTALARQAPNAN